MRQGPKPGDCPCYLFTFRLEDDYGVVDAVASGVDASHLLPGAPSPEQFRSNEGVRKRVEEALERFESEGEGALELRLRSYLTQIVPLRRMRGSSSARPLFCKRFRIVAPSSLETGCD